MSSIHAGILTVLILIAGSAVLGKKSSGHYFPILDGFDGRRSTSKLTAWSWTVALVSGAVYLFMEMVSQNMSLTDIGLDTLPEEYLVLIGLPFGSLVAAKLIVTSKVEAQSIVKTSVRELKGTTGTTGPLDKGGFTLDDRGQVSLQDVQYLTFNALLLVYFLAALLDQNTLPMLPTWLVGLTGVSAAAWVAGKGVTSETSEITDITKDFSRKTLHVRGNHLHQPVVGKGRPFEHLRDCVTVDGNDVDDKAPAWHGEEGFDVTLKHPVSSDTNLVVNLLGGVVLSKPVKGAR